MKKGVTVEQVARVTRAFTDAGIMVHAYLMYGFPTETAQDTVDALERVRQLFAEGCIQSAFWHRFAATAHSPIGKQPELFGITLRDAAPTITFAKNDVAFDDPTGCDHDFFGAGLRKALYNYMHGLGLDADRAHVVRPPRQGPEGKRAAQSGPPRARSLGRRLRQRQPDHDARATSSSELTATVPPLASMMRRTMDSPRPVPAMRARALRAEERLEHVGRILARHPEPVVGDCFVSSYAANLASDHRDRRCDLGPAVLERVLAEVPQDLVQQPFAAPHGRRREDRCAACPPPRGRAPRDSCCDRRARPASVRPVTFAVAPIRDSSSSSSTRFVICATPRCMIPVILACCGTRSPSR